MSLTKSIFISLIERVLFEIPEIRFIGILMSTKESQAVIPLADDESIVIRKVDERLWIVKWDKNYYLVEAENQLSNTKLLWDGEIPIM